MTGTAPAVLPRLTALRAPAAIAVFAFHIGRWDAVAVDPLPIGYAGVTFFFILSGFVLTWSWSPAISRASFYRRRVARVYPSHLCVLLIAVALPLRDAADGPLSLLASLLLIQAWCPDGDVAFGGNGVAWSLSCEATFYLLLPVVLGFLRGARPWVGRALAIAWFSGAAAVTAIAAYHGGGWEVAAFTSPALRFCEFLLGVVAALEVQRGARASRALVLGLAALGVIGVTLGDLPLPLPGLALAPAFVGVIVLAVQADLEGRGGWLVRRPMIYAGQLSFAFYLVHELVLRHLLEQVDLRGPMLVVGASALASAAAVLVHHGAERPVQAWLVGTIRDQALAAERGK